MYKVTCDVVRSWYLDGKRVERYHLVDDVESAEEAIQNVKDYYLKLDKKHNGSHSLDFYYCPEFMR